MKYKILTILLLMEMLPILLTGQTKEIVKTFLDKQKGKLSFNEGNIAFDDFISDKNSSILELKNILIREGNLIIDFNLEKFRSSEKKLNMQILPFVTTTSKDTFYVAPKYLTKDFNLPYNPKAQLHQLVWNNFQDQYRLLEDTIEFHLVGTLFGTPPEDCNNPPEFNIKQKKPHYMAAIVSLGMIISGYALENASETTYQKYQNEVFEGEANTQVTATYSRANRQNKIGGLSKNIGYYTLGINIAFVTTRYLVYKKRYKDFKYYCSPSPSSKLTFYPYWNTDPTTSSIGVGINYNF